MIAFLIPFAVIGAIILVLGFVFFATVQEAAKYIDAIIVIDWIIVTATFLLAFIGNFTRNASIPRKIMGSITVLAAAPVAIKITASYLPLLKEAAIGAQADSYNFFDTMVFGGIIWLIGYGLCAVASIRCATDDGDKLIIGYIGNALLVAIGIGVGNFFFDI